MSNEKKPDGGPAYPVNTGNSETAGACYPHQGMTLRDHFAGLAMNQMIPGILNESDLEFPYTTALWAYRYADAMLRAREQ